LLRRPEIRRFRKIALRRVEKLLGFAVKYYGSYPNYAVAAVRTAQRIAMHYRLRLPINLRRRFCKKCGTPFTGAGSVRVRVRNHRSTHVVVRCMKCGFARRYPVGREKLKYSLKDKTVG
jgi:ribonuclease P protein subunit RPR2